MAEKGRERLKARAITALLSSPTLETAAAKVGVSSKTLSRWLDNPDFRAAYEGKKRDHLRAGLGNLSTKTFDAVETLTEIAKCKGRKFQGPRQAAAAAILKLSMEAAVLEDFEKRLERLEKQGATDF